MARFCSWCGAALEPGARYCPECGARVLESVTVDGSADAVDKMRGLDIVDGAPLPADATAKLDRKPADTDTLVLPTDTEQKRFTTEGAPRKSRAALIVAIVVIVVLLIAVAVLAFLYVKSSQPAAPAAPVPVVQTDGGDSGQDAAKPSGAGAAADFPDSDKPGAASSQKDEELTEDEIFDALDAAYGNLPSYDGRIADCVEDFNGLFLAKSLDERTAAKKRAEGVLGDIQEQIEALEALDVPESSAYADAAADMMELYGCQAGRVSSLVDAWTLDVTFEVPSEHKDEILAKLAENNVGGSNKYLARYDELYPQAKPQREH